MSLLLSPLNWLLVGMFLLLLDWRGKCSALRLPAAVLLLVAWLALSPVGANWLVGRIEGTAVVAVDACESVEWVVVLAGGLDRAPSAISDYGALTVDSLRRVFALHADPPPPALRRVISGGGPHALDEATLISDLLRRLDPAGADPILETASQTTWESAQAVAALIPPPRRIAIASSALHLPRARLAFEAAGFQVCSWPLDRQYLDVSGWGAWRPQSTALRKSEAALHELVGALYYRWLAWRGAASSDA